MPLLATTSAGRGKWLTSGPEQRQSWRNRIHCSADQALYSSLQLDNLQVQLHENFHKKPPVSKISQQSHYSLCFQILNLFCRWTINSSLSTSTSSCHSRAQVTWYRKGTLQRGHTGQNATPESLQPSTALFNTQGK